MKKKMESENKIAGVSDAQNNSSKKKCKWSKNCDCSKSAKERFSKFQPLLKKMISGKPKTRMRLLKKAPTCLIRFLSECGLNILKGNLDLKEDQYERLRPHKRLLLKVSEPSLSLNERRKILLRKKGGFLPVLIPIAATILGGVVGDAISKAIGL